MTDYNREAVLSLFPGAVINESVRDIWTVWHEHILWGCGNTEAEAWKDAIHSIERHAGRKVGGLLNDV